MSNLDFFSFLASGSIVSLFCDAKLGTAADDGLKAVSFDALTLLYQNKALKFN